MDSDSASHRINGLVLTLPSGRLSGSGEIKLDAPYAVTAQASFAGNVAQRHIQLDAHAKGSLEKLALSLVAKGDGVAGDADIGVWPFAALPVEHARIAVHGIDPSLFSKSGTACAAGCTCQSDAAPARCSSGQQ